MSTALRLQPTEEGSSTLCGLHSGSLGRKTLFQEENLYKLHRVRVKVLASQSCPTLFEITWTVDRQAPLPIEFSRKEYWSGLPFPSPGDLPNSRIEPRCPALRVVTLPAELSGKPKNIGVGSLSLFQGIFLTEELTQGLLHCRRILFQLSYQGSQKSGTCSLFHPAA